MDRGFELMIPKKKKLSAGKFLFKYAINFTVFGREVDFRFNVKQKQE